MTRPRLVAGNWKMNKTPEETERFIERFVPLVHREHTTILLIPPFTSLDRAGKLLEPTGILLGAQDVHHEPEGAFTGEISVEMLLACSCRYVLVGHSERRHIFGESNDMVRRKLDAAMDRGLDAILCVGETLEERRAGQTETVLSTQLKESLLSVSPEDLSGVVLAYEPVWAIGTGETATPEQAQDAAQFIRSWVADHLRAEVARSMQVLYGGSVKPGNARELMSLPDIDGALVGGASLDPESFAEIVHQARE